MDEFMPDRTQFNNSGTVYVYEDEVDTYLDMGYDMDQLHVINRKTLYPDDVVKRYNQKKGGNPFAEVREIVRDVLKEAFEFDNNKTFTVPPNVAQRAQEAINAASTNNLTTSGTNLGSGLSKAKELAAKQTQSFDQMRRMKSFFDTQEQAYRQEKAAGKDVKSSGVIQAWELHGGDSGRDWVNQEMGSLNKDNLNTKKNARKAGGAATNKGMGIFDKNMMSTNNHRIHR